MPRARIGLAVAATAALVAFTIAPSRAPSSPPVTTKQIIAVYLGTMGTDSQSGMVATVRDMRTALTQQTASNRQGFVLRGVSLEPSVDYAIRHLALFGGFDEISAGGNWTNSSVVRYLGGNMGDHQVALIPQVVLLEREVTTEGRGQLTVGPERVIGRHIGTGDIVSWVKSGAPLPQ